MTLNNTNPSSEAAAAGSPNQMYIPDEVYSPSIEITCNIGALITRIGFWHDTIIRNPENSLGRY